MTGDPRDHHVVPQFFLRNFAVDAEKLRVTTLSKEGSRAIWKERSIKNIGYERDFYVHIEGGRPVSVETDISRRIETPISQSDTWKKIESGQAHSLDRSDRTILYALVRHLEARTPHFLQTGRELAQMASDPNHSMQFSDEEREVYAALNADPELEKAFHNRMASRRFDERSFDSAIIVVGRSAVPLRTATTPVLVTKAPPHPSLALPLPGMIPFQRTLTLNRRAAVTVIDGDFDGHFANLAMEDEWGHGVNRSFATHFSHFNHVRHLVCVRSRLIDDMIWAPYELTLDTPAKLAFRRKPPEESSTGQQEAIRPQP